MDKMVHSCFLKTNRAELLFTLFEQKSKTICSKHHTVSITILFRFIKSVFIMGVCFKLFICLYSNGLRCNFITLSFLSVGNYNGIE